MIKLIWCKLVTNKNLFTFAVSAINFAVGCNLFFATSNNNGKEKKQNCRESESEIKVQFSRS